MLLDFSVIEQAINQTKIEVNELDTAVNVLSEAKAKLIIANGVVAEAQAVVADAFIIANKEKADVVNGINQAITALQDLLTQLA
jgi:hypothetical protein